MNDLVAKFNALEVRERLLIAFAGAAILFFLVDSFFSAPLEMNARRLRTQIDDALEELEMEQVEIDELMIASESTEARPEDRGELLTRQLRSAEEQIKQRLETYIPPSRLPELLRDMLAGTDRLTLIAAQKIPPAPISPQEQESQPFGIIQESREGLFRHGLRLEFEGGFADTVAYLQRIEALPWRIFWAGVDYRVEAHPLARVVVEIYTLGKQEEWISG